MKSKALFIVAVVVVALLQGCSSKPKYQATVDKVKGLTQEQVLEKTGEEDRPVWINETFFEADGVYFATGGVRNGSEYAMTIRLAKAEALKNLLESIEVKARSEFSTYAEGSNLPLEDVTRFTRDGISFVVENLRVRGIRSSEVYYERVVSAALPVPTYNAWVKLEISEEEYLLAKVEAARRIMEQAKSERNKNVEREAKALLDKLTI